MSSADWELLREDYRQAKRLHDAATKAEQEAREARARADLTVRHYEDSLLTLTQHTIEDA